MRVKPFIAFPAILLGVFALLLAHDVRSWQKTIRAAALEYPVSPTKPVRIDASTAIPGDAAGKLLAVGRNREWLEALRKFDVAYQQTRNVEDLDRSNYAVLNLGEVALRKLTQDPDPHRASQAFDLLAVLVFREAFPGINTNVTLVQQGVTDLQNAVRLDQTNEFAKENLELGLRVLAASQTPSTGRSPANHVSNKRGGGYGEPAGEGY